MQIACSAPAPLVPGVSIHLETSRSLLGLTGNNQWKALLCCTKAQHEACQTASNAGNAENVEQEALPFCLQSLWHLRVVLSRFWMKHGLDLQSSIPTDEVREPCRRTSFSAPHPHAPGSQKSFVSNSVSPYSAPRSTGLYWTPCGNGWGLLDQPAAILSLFCMQGR